ncbi:MAG: xanthan lyase [Planctomycetota bacterium]|nr:MAG: xanthan lyase [Planctomycetota bacterium]
MRYGYRLFWMAIVLAVVFAQCTSSQSAKDESYDVVIYGGSSAGVTAALQCARLGRSVVLIEASEHIGGLTSGGLGATDIGNKAAIGGLARQFYQLLWQHYAKDASWTWQKRSEYRSVRQQSSERTMWTFEPSVAEATLRGMLAKHEIKLVTKERLNRRDGIQMSDGRISAIRMESGRSFAGRMFIDTSYEGDLMALAGVSFTVGRESKSRYGESLNGIQVKNAVHHQFVVPVDPYVVAGDKSSGLLPGITEGPLPPDGSGDHRVQAYCFRMCITDIPENRAEWVKPKDYDEKLYELLFRNFEAGDMRIPWSPIWMPNRKTDTNNNFAVSTDFIGHNYEWPNASYAERERIFARHLSYQQGLLWSLAHHPRVPEQIRKHFQKYGPAKDEFVDHGNWPHQLYVREARRMVSDYVMTQHDCQGRRRAKDAVGLAAYTMDSHNIQRYVDEHGHVRNEGDVQVGGFPPYPISYRSIRPKKSECKNLLVPLCLSASHIAYGSIRMEPVFMVLGQSAASAASLAIQEGVAVQDIPIKALQQRLLADGQVLDWAEAKGRTSTHR